MRNFRYTSIYWGLTGILFFFLTSGCDLKEGQNLPERNWSLTWSDEFDGQAGALPNAQKWAFDIGRGDNGWGNSELQYYTNRPQNAALDGNGNLVITAIKENFGGASYTSARLKTKDIFTQKYGRFEARIQTPYGQGIWPAFWMLGDNIETATWPLCGEIDVMEQRGQEPSVLNGSLHGPGFSGANPLTGKYVLKNSRFDTGFHVYAVEWFEDRIDFFVDDLLYHRITKKDIPANGQWVYDHPFFMILNVAVGGNYVGAPNTGTNFPQKMIIDYVKVYQEM
ncbi:MAG TPA: glycosyl hydrolase family 16 [Cytophagales bacterium]|nr:glycosyl hydrolase family 16 [Cytophagales bacterium]HRR08094.1 glycoside hydrolase family 16 protein [Rhodothermales bacterium]